MTTIDWNKPIEYNHSRTASGWTPARVICKDRKSQYGNTITVLYIGTDGFEYADQVNPNGVDGSHPTIPLVRNVPPTPQKKKFWTVIYRVTWPLGGAMITSTTYRIDPGLKVGDDLRGGTVINIVEGEYEG